MTVAYPRAGPGQPVSVEPAKVLPVPLAVGDVALDVLGERVRLDRVLTDLRRDAEGHRPGRHLGVVGHDRSRPDQRAAADDRAVQDDGAGADEGTVLDRAP